MDALESLSDAGLITHLRQGNQPAFRVLFERYAPTLIGFAQRYTGSLESAQDAVQDVFITVWNSRTSLYIHDSVKAYLYTSVRNRALRMHERERHGERYQSAVENDMAYSIPTSRNDGEAQLGLDDLTNAIYRALHDVPPRAREIFLLSREEGLTPSEIATMLGIGAPTVYNQLTKVVRHLTQQLTDWAPKKIKNIV